MTLPPLPPLRTEQRSLSTQREAAGASQVAGPLGTGSVGRWATGPLALGAPAGVQATSQAAQASSVLRGWCLGLCAALPVSGLGLRPTECALL